jgi:phosphate-selective porin OprO/OprP
LAAVAATARASDSAAAPAPQNPPAAEAKPQSSGGDFKVFWKDGLKMETADKAFKMAIGGRIHYDWNWGGADEDVEADKGAFEDGTQFRRARLAVTGTMYERIEFKAEFDFGGQPSVNRPATRDLYLGMSDVLGGGIRAGHFKEPFSLEQYGTSANYMTFVERSVVDALVPGRNNGVMYHGASDSEVVTWALGVFKTSNDAAFAQGDGDYAATARVSASPWYAEKGEKVLHVGASYTTRGDDAATFSTRSENSLGPVLVSTGALDLDGLDIAGVELAWVMGSLSLQAEAVQAMADQTSGEDADFLGWYAYASYFLTGETRPYKRSNGSFDRVRPDANFGQGGNGAWELAARYSVLDLDDGAIQGGELNDVTVGVNWYLNPNARVMANYVIGDLEDDTSEGDVDAFLLRLQVDF